MLGAGCRTMAVPKLTAQKADAYEHHVEKDGLVIGVHALTDKSEVKQMFNVNLLNNGVVPILVVVENRSANSSFVVAKDKVFVVSEATGNTNISERKEVASGAGGQTMATIGAVGLVVSPIAAGPLLLAGLKMASDATVIEHGLRDKEFYTRTLGPGQKTQGIIYFQFPKKTLPSGKHRLVAQIKSPITSEVTPYEIEVDLSLKQP